MIRNIDFRYVTLRNGAECSEICPAEGSEPVVVMDDSGEIKTSLSGTFRDPGDDVDWLNDEIRPELIINGVPHPLGIYRPTTVRFTRTETGRTVMIQAYDRCWQVQAKCTEVMPCYNAALNYLAPVGSLLREAGIITIAETATNLTLAETREDWSVGTPNLTIVNQLLGEINYKPLWFDQDGSAILEPVKLPQAGNIDHFLDDTSIESLMFPQLDMETDIYSAPNVFVCICSNADKAGPMMAIGENTNPQSPLSIARRGRRITQVVNVNNIASQQELQAYANRLVTNSMFRGEIIEVETCLLPGFGVGDIVAFRYGDVMTLCEERSWSMSLSVGGRMHHRLERIVLNVD